MKSIHRHSASKRGFTLTELLVVILIIAVLAVLSIMMVGRMRNMADKVAATRSLSQLQIANTSYAGDNNGRYVGFRIDDEDGNRIGWWYQVPEFLNYFRGEAYTANGQPDKTIPAQMLDPKVVRAKADKFSTSMAGSFGINVNGLPSTSVANADRGYNTSNVTKPEQSMAFGSACDVSLRYGTRLKWDGKEGVTHDSRVAYRHGNKALFVYFDGHVAELSKEEIKALDNKGGSKHPFWLPNQK
jgi:prepilin-type N-terminal cleavage/methylation domain-containing protein/prepilin-type processing-associated H-X9-DG protein